MNVHRPIVGFVQDETGDWVARTPGSSPQHFKHLVPPFIWKIKNLPPLRDEGFLRGTTPITFNLQTSLVCCNGLSRR